MLPDSRASSNDVVESNPFDITLWKYSIRQGFLVGCRTVSQEKEATNKNTEVNRFFISNKETTDWQRKVSPVRFICSISTLSPRPDDTLFDHRASLCFATVPNSAREVQLVGLGSV
jgi:hypothetical protein